MINSSSSTIIINNGNNTKTNTNGEANNNNDTRSNMVIHQEQQCQAKAATFSTNDTSQIEPENYSNEKTNSPPVSISHSLPPLPTANNLMSTRPRSKKKGNK